MSKLTSIIKIIEVDSKKHREEEREPLDDLLYNVIVETLVEMANNFKDDFTEQVVINLLLAGDDEGYSEDELKKYIKEIKA